MISVALSATACRQQNDYFGKVEPPAQNEFRYNNGAEPEYLDPALMVADTDWRIAEMLFEGLAGKDPETGQARPAVAERWDVSEDRLVYTFHLRSDAIWTDGRPVTAHDFVYAWIRVLDPKTASRYASPLYLIENAEAFNQGKLTDPSHVGLRALDDHTLEVRLNAPASYFVHVTTNPMFYPAPRWAVEKYGTEWTRPEHIVGNGPFRLVEHRIHDRIVTERNPRYWNARTVRLNRVVAYAIDDYYTSANMYESGRIDWIPSGYFPSEYFPYMRGRFHDYESKPYLSIYYYAFNVTRKPLDNVLVRKALTMAVDRKAITDELLRGGQIPGTNFVALGLPGYQSPPGWEFNPEEGARLLAQAGYPNGQGFPDIELRYNTSDLHKKVAEAIQQMWAKHLNIHIRLHTEEWASFLKTRHNLEHDIARDGWIADYPDPSAFADLMESTNENNDTGWKNAEYDRLLNQSRRETDTSKRYEILEQAEAILLREAPVLPIFTYASNTLIKPYVRGIHSTPQDTHPLAEVCIDRRWRERSDPAEGTCD